MTEHESINNPIRPDVCIPVPTHQLFLRIGRREKPFLKLKEYRTLHFMLAGNQFSHNCPAKIRQRHLQIGYITSPVCCYLLSYACSVSCSDQR